MQRLLQRTKQAERQAARQGKKVRDRKVAENKFIRRQSELRLLRTCNQHIREARQHRQEDWEAGPALAPRRDVGDLAETYATMSVYDMNIPIKRPEERLKWIPIRKGDRVVVTRGRERGRIGTVENVDKKRSVVTVEDINMVDLNVPDWVPREEGDTRGVVGRALPMPIGDVRLVYPLKDPETGIPKDVVIDRLVPKFQEKVKGRVADRGERVIAGTTTIIPWPAEAEKEHEEYENDTSGMLLEAETFRPLLLYPPMPVSVIDELRNKYSKFRTRHDWEFVQKMEKVDEVAERRKELHKTMRTPLQELAELRARQKAAEARELSEEQLAKIGEVIALERAKASDAVKRLN